jgi:hypothetical protein
MEASSSQRKSKRNPVAAWFAERRRVKKEQGDETVEIHAFRDETIRNGLPSRVERRGQDIQHVYTSDNARVHIGDQYIEQQNIYPSPAEETDDMREQKFMDNLRFDAMSSRLDNVGTSYADTGSWLFEEEEYKRWRDPEFHASHNGVLWIKGKPGAGKSTLMKHALRHMHNDNQDNSAIVSFFFNARGYGLEKSSEGMYRSLLYQILKTFPQRLPGQLELATSTWRTQGWPLQVLQDLLRRVCLDFGNERKIVGYVDALDECSEDTIRSALGYFEELSESAHSRRIGLSFCLASRHYPNITMGRHETINLDEEGKHQSDISLFVTRWLRGGHDLRADLIQQISQRSLGVFLWAELVVQIMNTMMDGGTTRSQLLEALSQVPDRIEDLLRSITMDGDLALLSTLQWVLFSKRKLDVPELFFAVKTSIGHLSTAWHDAAETSEEQMRLFILTSSKGLVEFTSGGPSRAQFIHETVREHLLNGGLILLDAGLAGNFEALSHARLGQWCHDYIKASQSSRTGQSLFLPYSRNYMLDHMESAHSGGALDLISIDSIPQKTWVSLFNSRWRPETITPILFLIESGYMGIAEAILQRQMAHSRMMGDQSHMTTLESLGTSAKSAAELGSLPGIDRYNTALQAALSYGNQSGVHPAWREVISTASRGVIETLLECDADPLLVWNAAYQHEFGLSKHPNSDFIKMSLRFGVDPNSPISGESDFEESALANAVRMGDDGLVDSLLIHKASVKTTGLKTLLMLVARYPSLSILQSLLMAGARVDERDQNGRTALHEVSYRGKAEGVQLTIARALLDAGAEIDATDNAGETPLTLAYERQRYDVAKLLLDLGADANLPRHREISRKLQSSDKDGIEYNATQRGPAGIEKIAKLRYYT